MQRRRSVPEPDHMAMTMVKRGIAANNEIMNGEGAAGDPEQISLRTFGGGGGGRRRSFVAHEEADFAVKVHSWQRRINEELGTDDVASLGRRRSVAGDEVASPFEAHFGQDLLHSRPDGFPMDDDLLDGRGGVVLRKRKRKKSAASSRGGDGGGRAAPDQRPRPISCSLGVIFRVCPKKSEQGAVAVVLLPHSGAALPRPFFNSSSHNAKTIVLSLSREQHSQHRKTLADQLRLRDLKNYPTSLLNFSFSS